MSNTLDFAMFTDEGNARLHLAIDAFLRQGEFDSPFNNTFDMWKVYDDLVKFLAGAAELESHHEWHDTAVRESIRWYLEKVFGERKFRMLI
jgi:hypothetical protein